MLICSMACLLFVAFLFGVVVGNDLDIYPEKISRQMPVKFLEWTGLLEVEKAPPPMVVIKSEKTEAKEETRVPGSIIRDIINPPPSKEANAVKGVSPSPEQMKVKEPPPFPLSGKVKIADVPLVKPKDKESAAEKYVVQVTSCKSKKIAEEVVRKIGGIGLKARIVTAELKDKGMWYRVLLSDLDGKDKAKEAAEKIDRLLKGNKSIVRAQKR
jgi:cell division protein FtsN